MEFQDEIKYMKEYNVLMIPHHHTKNVSKEENGLEEEIQKKYQSGVGTLNYLTKFSCTDLSNAVRDLRKNMTRENLIDWEQLKRTIKYTTDTINLGLHFQLPITNELNWNINCFSDSNWGGDKDNRRRVSGWFIILNNFLISWGSLQQGFVTL